MQSPFSRAQIILLVSGAVILFSLSILLRAYDDTPESPGDAGYKPNSFSVSAIGYAGLYDLLYRLDRPVERSTGNTLALVGSSGTLVLAEPDLSQLAEEDVMKFVSAPRMLLILPKWRGTGDGKKPAWIRKAELMPPAIARQVLTFVTGRNNVLQDTWPESWKTNDIGPVPSGTGTIQLMTGEEMKPVVGNDNGMLVGEIINNGRKIWILADPDILSNHGLVQGNNAAFALALIDSLRSWNNSDDDSAIVFDETIHGFRDSGNSLLKMMFRFPFIIITALVFLVIAVLLWAGTGRFGAPQKDSREIDFGKRVLVGNGARLLDFAGYHDAVLRRYLAMTIRSVAQALHAPTNLNEPSLHAWLDQIGKARNVGKSCADIVNNVTQLEQNNARHLNRLFGMAHEIYIWKKEILNGTAQNRHHH